MRDFEIGKALAFIDEHIEDKFLLNDLAMIFVRFGDFYFQHCAQR